MSDDVEHPMGAVAEVHVGDTDRAEHDLISGGNPTVRVRCRVIRGSIGFGFHDSRRTFTVMDYAAEQRLSRRDGVVQDWAFGHDSPILRWSHRRGHALSTLRVHAVARGNLYESGAAPLTVGSRISP